MRRIPFLYVCFLLCLLVVGCQERKMFDVVIRHGFIYDGSNTPGFYADIGINADSIAFIGPIDPNMGRRELDASGLLVTPGFIDLHAHVENIMELPQAENFLRQGVTTALGGPDGGGPWPFDSYIDSLQSLEIGINIGYLVGHNTLRKEVMGLEGRRPSAAELEEMASMVEVAMKNGAFGISTGLKYLPGIFSETDEIIYLSRMASRYGGIYTSHLRDEGRELMSSVQEALVIGREADIPVIITHHKAIGKPMWGKSAQSLFLIDSAREAGLDVMVDQYPYTASSTNIGILIPSWAMEGGNDAYLRRLTDKLLYDSMKAQVVDNLINDRGGDDLRRIQFSDVAWDPSLNGKTLYDLALREGKEPNPSNGADLVLMARSKGSTQCVFHAIDENDVKRIMARPYTAIASDGSLTRFGEGNPHPRSYGTFPRIIEKYVRTDSILELSEAIYKMTGLPATRLGLDDRGFVRKGYKADLIIFNLEELKEMGTYVSPHAFPEGIKYVLINGNISLENGSLGSMAGSVLLANDN